MSTTTGIRELKARLSQYLKRVREGETVVITDRGKPIGQIIPYEQTSEERLEQLQVSGLIAWSGQRPSAQAPIVRARGEKTVAELLLEDRE
jgi:prevent-host-death family protein